MPDARRAIEGRENGGVGEVASGKDIARHGDERRTIVVIDDDPSIRTLLELHLKNAGYEVFSAEDAVDGGHLVVKAAPDLVICDVHMPYMDGYEFVAALKSDPLTQHIPVIFLSTDDDIADNARKFGAIAYLRKPVLADRLLEIVALFALPTAIAVPR